MNLRILILAACLLWGLPTTPVTLRTGVEISDMLFPQLWNKIQQLNNQDREVFLELYNRVQNPEHTLSSELILYFGNMGFLDQHNSVLPEVQEIMRAIFIRGPLDIVMIGAGYPLSSPVTQSEGEGAREYAARLVELALLGKLAALRF